MKKARLIQSLVSEFEGKVSTTWKGTAYRCALIDYATPENLISGKGAEKHGARWIMPGVAPAVHLSSTEQTAVRESSLQFERYGFKNPLKDPRVIVAIHTSFSKVLDLSRLDGLKTGFTLRELLEEDWEELNRHGQESLSQCFGRAACALKYEAILAPSARIARGKNLVVFPRNLSSGSLFRIQGEEKLRQWLE